MVVLRGKEEKRKEEAYLQRRLDLRLPLSSSLVLAERVEESLFMSGSVNIAHTLRNIHHTILLPSRTPFP